MTKNKNITRTLLELKQDRNFHVISLGVYVSTIIVALMFLAHDVLVENKPLEWTALFGFLISVTVITLWARYTKKLINTIRDREMNSTNDNA